MSIDQTDLDWNTGPKNADDITIMDFKDPDYPVDITLMKGNNTLGSAQFTKAEVEDMIKELKKIIKNIKGKYEKI